MAKSIFEIGETVICSCTVKNQAGTLVDPATSMKITITCAKDSVVIVDDVAMTNDDVGDYHYDWNTAITLEKGNYNVIYKATDGTRISIKKDLIALS